MAKTDAKGAEAFIQCVNCKKIVFARDFEQNLKVCPLCDHHHRLPARQRIEWTFDEGSFEEMDTELRSKDPLNFPEYGQKLSVSQERSDAVDSIISGVASLEGEPVAIAVSDFSFMGGSMGSVAGEKIARTFERAIERRIPVVVFCASGGARMQEGPAFAHADGQNNGGGGTSFSPRYSVRCCLHRSDNGRGAGKLRQHRRRNSSGAQGSRRLRGSAGEPAGGSWARAG